MEDWHGAKSMGDRPDAHHYDKAPEEGASPRPWRASIEEGNGHGVTPPPIRDANGRPVLDTSEWLTISDDNVRLMVAGVNSLPSAFEAGVALTGEPIHTWFSLTRSNYLVIPRLALQSMPVDWQARLVGLLEEATRMGLETPSDYKLERPGYGENMDPWADYRHGDFVEVHGKPLLSGGDGVTNG